MVGIRQVRQTVEDAAAKLASTAEDTKAAVVAVAVLGVVALAIGLIALGVAMKARTA